MAGQYDQWIRKISLLVLSNDKAIDLSEFRIRFSTQNADNETPNNATIRVYNLAQETINTIRKGGEFSKVILNAGYESGAFGVIFNGTIIQYRIGRENNRDTYLDILANDGDIGYNQGIVNTSVAKGGSAYDLIQASVAAMNAEGGSLPVLSNAQHTTNIRGAVLFGMARARLRYLASSLDASWSMQDGKVQMIPLKGYLPGQAVKINNATGMVGVPEQTDGGIKVTCLLNPLIRIGGLIELNNAEINQLVQRDPTSPAALAYDKIAGIQYNTPLSKGETESGTYRAYVVEHSGDTRGNEWHSSLICLSIDISASTVKGIT